MVYWVDPAGTLFVGIFFPISGALALGLRFWSRTNKTGKGFSFGVDDYLILPAFALMIGCSSIFIAGYATNTIGSHNLVHNTEELLLNDDPRQILLEKYEFAFNILQILALGLTKLSILFFYRRIFFGKRFEASSWVVIGLTLAWIITFIILVTAGCGTHLSAVWGPLIEINTYCPRMFSMFLGLAIVDVAVDLMIMLLPLPWIFRLQMPWRRKLGVAGIFLVGTLAIACGITRLYFFVLITSPALLFTLPPDDIAIVSDLMFWGMVETGTAVVASCLPTILPAMRAMGNAKAFQSLRGSLTRLLTLSKGSMFSRDKSERDQRSESTTTINPGGKSNSEVSNDYELGPISVSEQMDPSRSSGKIHVENEYRVERMV